MKKLAILTLSLLLVMLALSGCGASKTEATPTPAQATTNQTTAASPTPAKAAQEPTATTAPQKSAGKTEVAPTPTQEETLSLDSRDAALDKLKSYRMHWLMEWTSIEVTKTTNAGWDWLEEYSSDPQALHWIWKSTEADASESAKMETWQIGDTMYMLSDAAKPDSCMSFSSEDQSNQLTKGIFSPNSLGSVKDAKYVGTDTVNGIKAKHYKYDEKSVALGGFGKVAGEIWVAVDGGYVVKDMMKWEGGAGVFGTSGDANGEGQWSWELSDVNAKIDIKAPENCGGAAKGLPIMPDATEKATFGDTTMYSTASKLADVVEFYKKELPAAGWKAEGEPFQAEGMSTLSYVKDAQTLQVTISDDKGKISVILSITK